jgi:[ribosomal protein S18]-alanine N-acetyltransferase
LGKLQLVTFDTLTALQWDALVCIEAACHSTPWTRSQLQTCVAQGHTTAVMLSEQAQVLGYSVFMPNVDDWELLNLTIEPSQQGRGLGQQLLAQGVCSAKQAGTSGIFLEVRPSNTAALALYHGAGFISVGRRKAYYSTANHLIREDALILRLDL